MLLLKDWLLNSKELNFINWIRGIFFLINQKSLKFSNFSLTDEKALFDFMVLQTATKQILVFFSNRSGEKFNLVKTATELVTF